MIYIHTPRTPLRFDLRQILLACSAVLGQLAIVLGHIRMVNAIVVLSPLTTRASDDGKALAEGLVLHTDNRVVLGIECPVSLRGK